MTDQSLSDLLERLGDRTPVGPPPLGGMVRRVRTRRRRRVAISSVGATLAVTASAWVAVTAGPGSHVPADRTVGPAASPTLRSTETPSDTDDSEAAVLTEGAWRLVALVGDDGQSLLTDNDPPVDIVIGLGGLRGSTACGTFRSDTRIPIAHPRAIAFDDPAASSDGTCNAVSRVVDRLAAVRYFKRVDEDTLTLHAENRMILLDLQRIRRSVSPAPPSPLSAALPCPAEEQTATLVVVPLPGHATAEEAVEPFSYGGQASLTVDEVGGRTVVLAVRDDSTVYRVYDVRELADGWSVDGYREC